MRTKNITISLVLAVALALVGMPATLAQQSLDFGSSSLPVSSISSPDDRLHALSLTRFHFITLKEFHSNLFSVEGGETTLRGEEAAFLNKAINAFLTSPTREAVLLKALRDEKAVQLRFSLKKKTDNYQMVRHPSKELLYRIQPETELVPITINIRPLLDGPNAFRVTVFHEGTKSSYLVDWSGRILS